jgi:branched-chain amino acid transport system permease protein
MSPAVARGALGVAFAGLLAAPLLLSGSYLTFMLILVFVYVVVAIGLNVLTGYAGQFSLGHAALMAIGAYVSALSSKALAAQPWIAATGSGVWLGIVLGTVAAGAAGAALAIPALRLKGPYLAMVTVAFGWVVWKLLIAWVSVTGGDLGITAIPRPRIGPHVFDITDFYYLGLAAMAAAIVLQRNLVLSDVGRKLRALKHSEIAAAAVGIDVHREKVLVFVVSALFAGFGGALFAHLQNYINPDNFQFFNSVFFILAILFGGAGTLAGPVIGAAFLTIVPELLHDAERYRLIIYGLIILVTLFFLPRGIAGSLPAATRAVPRAGAGAAARPLDAPPPASDTPVMAAVGISKSFGGIQALKDVGVAISAGTIHALIGPNGAGKTTLINILSGFYRPDRGQIMIDGRPVAPGSLYAAARLGVVRTFQSIKLFGDMTVREHVMIGCELQAEAGLVDALLRTRRYRREAQRRHVTADALLELVGLAGFADSPANALPYGHRRLLEIARALAGQPRVLLLDEPAAGLVASEIDRLAELIETLRRQGMAILLVEHHMDLVMRVSGTVTVLDYGEIIGAGAPDAVRRDPRVIEAYLGTADDRDLILA